MKLADIKSIEAVKVYKNYLLAGILSRTKLGCQFVYDEKYLAGGAAALAFHLPTSQKIYYTSGDNLLPFFAGLLPEGLRLTALISALKTSGDDMFSILAASGEDCIGDVHVELPNFTPKKIPKPNIDLEHAIFADLFHASITATDYQARLQDSAIAGVHPKISAQMISFPVTLAKRKKRYILKLGQKDYPRLVENEYFFMQLAKTCGLETAHVQIVYDQQGNSGLLVERFDRRFSKSSKSIEKLHMEDGCQLLNRYPQDKYRISLRELAATLKEYCTAPIIEINKLIQLVAFSYLIGNGDLHAKNISVITYPEQNRTTFGPVYDLLSTLVYGDTHMALKLEGNDQVLSLKHFIQFARAFDLRAEVVRTTINKLCVKIEAAIPDIQTIGFNLKKTNYLQRSIAERINKMKTELGVK